MRLEVERAGHVGPQGPHVVRQRRDAEPGRQLAREGGPADRVTTLDQRDAPAGAGQHGGADQAVHAPADDDDRRAHRRASFRMRSAAFLPGAPMMPPPGWVAEPHM